MLAGKPEALHQMRVGVRRLRTAISFFKDVVFRFDFWESSFSQTEVSQTEGRRMFIRVAAAICAALLVIGCEQQEAAKKVCKGLSEAACTAKAECEWKAKKDKCIMKQPESSSLPAASERAPPPPSAPSAPSAPSDVPQTPAPPQ
jgi:hypothetical protein